jgi:response regulator of citrate/malate metabolism
MLKVLIVEDDLMIADMVNDRLELDQFDVCGIATNITEALALASMHHPDLAVVDVRLADGDLGTNLAVDLKRLYKIGILYATGNIELVIRDSVGEGCMQKPYNMAALSKSLRIVHRLLASGEVPDALPDGLLLLNAL